MLDEKEMDKIVGGGEELEKRLPPVGGLFQVPANQFWGKNTWNFFRVCTIARVLFYQCSPYHHKHQPSGPPHRFLHGFPFYFFALLV
jgi:hypothetical protein